MINDFRNDNEIAITHKPFPTKKIASFTDLLVWREGHALVLHVYDLTRSFPDEEKFGLISQMRRSAVSITSNIAEGFGRHTYKEKTQFYYQAQGSLAELENQLLIAKDLSFISVSDFDQVAQQANKVHQLLIGFIRKTKTFVDRKS